MKALILSTFSGITPHTVCEAVIRRSLIKAKWDVDVMTCKMLIEKQCAVFDATLGESVNDPNFQAMACKNCIKTSMALLEPNYDLHSLYQPNASKYDAQISQLLVNLTRSNFFDFSFEEVPFGRIATYQFLIKMKKYTPDFDENEFLVIRQELKNALKVYIAVRDFLRQTSRKPDIAILYNTLYSCNSAARFALEAAGVKVYSLHSGLNLKHFLNTFFLIDSHNYNFFRRNKLQWPSFRDKPCSTRALKRVTDHFMELAKATSVFVYSGPINQNFKDFESTYNIKPDQKIVLVAMSSYDERFAVEFTGLVEKSKDAIYKNQIEWVSSIVEFAKTRPELFFLIRLHPREFPNKREAVQSKHALELLEALKNLPSNVALNLPSHQFSLYQIAGRANVILTAWSSVAKEMTLLGLPVVNFVSDILLYPGDLVKIGKTREEYFALIDSALSQRWDFQRCLHAFRWYALEFEHNVFRMTANLNRDEWGFFERNYRKILRRISPNYELKRQVGKVIEEQSLINMLEAKDQKISAYKPDLDLFEKSAQSEKQFVIKSLKEIYGKFFKHDAKALEFFMSKLSTVQKE